MGLLPPSSGQIVVDGFDLYNPDYSQKLMAWRSNIAHVPQTIYLADTSIAENIALGIPKDEIDLDRVRRAAELAQVIDFIDSTNDGYDTFVGERGVRLSGGQRQRIGIARALYKRVQILVLDEATSALDNSTESSVMYAIESLDDNLTIISIAHRLSTLRNCDRIITLKNGHISSEGSPDDTIKIS